MRLLSKRSTSTKCRYGLVITSLLSWWPHRPAGPALGIENAGYRYRESGGELRAAPNRDRCVNLRSRPGPLPLSNFYRCSTEVIDVVANPYTRRMGRGMTAMSTTPRGPVGDNGDHDVTIERHLAGRHAYQFALVAVLFLDLDWFKLINDRFGHAVGDQVLVQVDRRLTATVREIDTVSRLGGDKFIILLPRIAHDTVVATLAERIRAVLIQPVVVGGRRLTVSASLGMASSGSAQDQPEELLERADAAMYLVKTRARMQARAT